jgi:hypothetical protein
LCANDKVAIGKKEGEETVEIDEPWLSPTSRWETVVQWSLSSMKCLMSTWIKSSSLADVMG